MSRHLVDKIDALLPQTQCGLCGYGGCMPYAKALANKEAPINLCPPGGINTLQALGSLLNQDASPFLAEMTQKAKPLRQAVIREEACIGCTKCIKACPVDAIIGSAKQMHTVIASECTGCELCIAPCPVDCIDMVTIEEPPSEIMQKTKRDLARNRFNGREKRLKKTITSEQTVSTHNSLQDKRKYIEAAILRAKKKKPDPY